MSNEQRAILEVNRLESRVAVGAFTNHTDRFSDFRQRYERTLERNQSFDDGEPLTGVESKRAELVDDESSKASTKTWIVNKHNWDVDFRTMDLDLKTLKALYSDKAVVSFDRDREASLNKKIARTVKKLQSSFGQMKRVVDGLNSKLYCEDKTRYCGPGKEFENITEWRLAERIVTDLTTRLRDKQQNLNVIVMMDKRHSTFINNATSTSDPEVRRLEAVIQDTHDRERLEQETDDVKSIVKSVRDIVKMVQQMSMMITQQGTIVDRIDYNLEVASARTLKGQDYFQKAEDKNKKAGAMALWCVGILVILNSIMAILIMYKIHADTK